MHISKKTIILSIVITVLVGVAVIATLWLVVGKQSDQVKDTVKEGDFVSVEQTPDLKTCEMLSTDAIKNVLGDTVSSLSDGERSGIIAQNLQKADTCQYDFTVNDSIQSQLILQTYTYTAEDIQDSGNIFDSTWRNIDPVTFPEWNTGYPAYFKQSDAQTNTRFVLEVLFGPRYNHFEIVQPSDQTTFTKDSAAKLLVKLALQADYTVADDPDAPPSPSPAPEPPKITSPEKPDCVSDGTSTCPDAVAQPVSTTK